jgi:FkbM family methyltransferase
MNSFKKIIRCILIFLNIDLTKNLEYDRLTQLVIKRILKKDSNCIDVGAHKGEILDYILKQSPEGKHYGFEPIPEMYEALTKKFHNKATIYQYALSNKIGESTFNIVKNSPAYSGIKQRKYDIPNPQIEKIEVRLMPLDEVIPPEVKISFIKIDVEGGEFDVIKGGINLIKKDKPTIIFECGIASSDFYGVKPQEFYQLLNNELELKIYTLKSFLKKEPSLSEEEFIEYYHNNKEYYFIASSEN